ncbi:MAG: hypothetical protein K2X90_01230 [Candidatus Babeliaceae bacterium]|nr:hypothetical protein [Candidatus Babeliaceae bacterium]
MKKHLLLTITIVTTSMLYSEPQELEPVTEITPKQIESSKEDALNLPTPPAEIKAEGVKEVDLKITATPTEKLSQTKKQFSQMEQEEQINYLKRKVDKQREKNKKMRSEIKHLEQEINYLKDKISDAHAKIKDIKENHLKIKKGLDDV